MLQPLDGPSAQGSISLTTATVQELKVGASPFDERKVVSVQADKDIYIYFGDGTSTPSAATVAADGFTQPRDDLHSYEATCLQPIFVLAVSTTADVRFAERA